MNRKITYLFVLFLIPMVFHGQQTLNGVWSGTMQNDSVTLGKDQRFEITLTEYRNRIYGYTRRTFIVNDTLYYMLKRVKGKIEGDFCEVTDDEIVSYSFPGKPDKRVKVSMTFTRNPADGNWNLNGKWTTKEVRNRFYAIGGQLTLQAEADPATSEIISHLSELGLEKEMQPALAGVDRKADKSLVSPGSATTTASPVKQPPQKTESKTVANNSVAMEMPSKKDAATEKNANPTTVDSLETSTAVSRPAPTDASKKINVPAATAASKKADTSVAAPSNPVSATGRSPVVASAVTPTLKNLAPTPAADLGKRKNSMSQEVLFTADSLELALYDNGEVDGDTVSVLLNGQVILSREVLKASALRKTIAMPSGQDEFLLVLYAENLGKYPPNTGLLVVKDGAETYQIRFSADLTQNAAIIFRRRPAAN